METLHVEKMADLVAVTLLTFELSSFRETVFIFTAFSTL